jgi:LysM repeat protein
MRYTIKHGETLSGLAARFDTTVAWLVAANGIQDKNKIQAGDTIVVPGLWEQVKSFLRKRVFT